MWRPVLVLSTASLVGALAFIGASSASEPSVDFPPGLSASGLAAVELPAGTRLALQDLLGAELAAQYGIAPSSFEETRLVADTPAGPLYAVPGLDGICVVLLPVAASCGVPTADEVVAVFAPGPGGAALVGGGVTLAGVDVVAVKGEEAAQAVPAELVAGGFEVSETLELSASGGVEVEAE